MTVCIAAACKDKDDVDLIVLCTDRRIGSALGSSDTGTKERDLHHGWKCLTSGNVDDIEALVKCFVVRFHNKDALTYAKLDETIRGALFDRKKQIADAYTRTNFVMSHDDFLKVGKERLPEDIFRNAIHEMRSLFLKAEFVIAGFIGSSPEIYYTDANGESHAASDFAVVGEGEYVASSVLLRRKQHSWESLERTLYNVFEAKKYSEAVGSVGRETIISIIRPSGKNVEYPDLETSAGVDEQLAVLYEKYGPTALPEDLMFEEPLFYDWETKKTIKYRD